jgi:arylsulfatase A-like enzyme
MKQFIIVVLCSISLLCHAQIKPNILWITIEDTSPQFIGCYGDTDARTPVIDQLAKEGVWFTNAFSTGTVCSPSRSAIITGIKTYELGTGNHRSNYPVPDFVKGFPYYLQKEGYYATNNSKTDYNVANAKKFTDEVWNESSGKAGWWNRKAGQPFFAVFNFNDSHQSRTMTNTYEDYTKMVLDELPVEDIIAENAFKMPPFYRDSPEMRKQFARVYNSIKLTDNKIGKLLARLESDHLRDSTIIFFYADHGEGIPRGKTNGIGLGYRVPFVIWFPPMYKHLSPWGESGTVTEELIDFEDLAPTLISLAGGNVPEYMKGRILMGAKRSPQTDHLILSSDRSDNGIDMVRTVTNGQFVYSRNYLPYMPEARYIRYMEIGDIKQQMRQDLADNKLNDLQKSLFAPRPAEALYDLKNDPWEEYNLISDPKYKKVVNKMKNQLEVSILKSKDILFLPEYEIAQISETTTPYQFRMDQKRYPLKEIYEAAELSGRRGVDELRKQIKFLGSSNPIVRYWAIVGLRSQSAELLKSKQKELTAAMKDTYAPAGVTAAAIVYELFGGVEAETKLKEYSRSENSELALMAVNYLLYVSRKKPFIATIKEVRESRVRIDGQGPKDQDDYKVKAACMDFLGSLGLVPNNPTFSE